MGKKFEECHIPCAYLQHFSFQDTWSSKTLVTRVHFYIYRTQGIKAIEYQYMKVTGWSWLHVFTETCVIPILFIRKNIDQKSTFYGNYHTPQDYLTTERETQKTEYEKHHKQFQPAEFMRESQRNLKQRKNFG